MDAHLCSRLIQQVKYPTHQTTLSYWLQDNETIQFSQKSFLLIDSVNRKEGAHIGTLFSSLWLYFCSHVLVWFSGNVWKKFGFWTKEMFWWKNVESRNLFVDQRFSRCIKDDVSKYLDWCRRPEAIVLIWQVSCCSPRAEADEQIFICLIGDKGFLK